jgi:hypothetical protein
MCSFTLNNYNAHLFRHLNDRNGSYISHEIESNRSQRTVGLTDEMYAKYKLVCSEIYKFELNFVQLQTTQFYAINKSHNPKTENQQVSP